MAEPLDFYFDFSSPYAFLAAQEIDALAGRHGREVAWKPFLLGVAFKDTGQQPLLNIPLKGDYARRDLPRTARRLGVPFRLPTPFPFMAVAASRAYYWLVDRDPQTARELAKAVFWAAFAEGKDMSRPEAVADLATGLGVDREALLAALVDPAMKARLRDEVSAAIGRGVFGAPTVFVDGEAFWGHDRLADVERWLESGGW